MRIATVAGIALFVSLGSTGLAQAETIDYTVPPNGQWIAGEEKPADVTPAFSPIQVPAPEVTANEIEVYPYLSPWLHNVIAAVLPAGRSLEIQGAIHAALPDKPVSLNGHCLVGEESARAGAQTTLVHVEAGPISGDFRPSLG
jgi:hypothetical protein